MSTSEASIDFETRSTVDLKKAGAYRYFEAETTDVLCMAWRIGDGAVQLWRPGDEDPSALLEHIAAGGTVVAHNSTFEKLGWRMLRRRAYAHWPELTETNLDCTMGRGLALALPGTLDQLGTALKLRAQKDKDGHRLMLQCCKPRRVEPDGTVVWWEDEDRMTRLGLYCMQDVETEREAGAALPNLSASERRVWEFDQRINDRGVMIDRPTVERAIDVVAEALKRADERMWWLTDGEVRKCSEVQKIVAWLNARGIPCESVAKGEIEELVLSSSIMSDDTAEEVVRLRRAAGKTSTTKYKAMLASVCADGRVRGTLAYHGAGTGRWAGRLIQPQNFPRIDAENELSDLLAVIEILSQPWSKSDRCDAIEMLVGPAAEWLSKCLRAMLLAAPGKRFVSGDFSNIEGRVNAWLCGEYWKLEAFRAYDEGTGPDLYKLAYAKAFGISVDNVTKLMRQIGKVMELALGYQGSVGAFISMAAGYGADLQQIADAVKAAICPEAWARVASGYGKGNDYGLSEHVWTGIKAVVNGWREAHPNITQSWWDLQDAAIEAVGAPGIKVSCLNGKVQYLAANGFLYCMLPSGRVISYAAPRLVWTEDDAGRKRVQIKYMGVDSMTKRWSEQSLYGGVQSNNVVQGIARDLMVEAMFRVEEAGYPVVLTVHDELLSEVTEGHGSADDYQRIMSQLPAWAEGLPVATAAWEDKRYVK